MRGRARGHCNSAPHPASPPSTGRGEWFSRGSRYNKAARWNRYWPKVIVYFRWSRAVSLIVETPSEPASVLPVASSGLESVSD
jgi:hypothetical protein